MSHENSGEVAAGYWSEAQEAVAGLGGDHHAGLNAATGAIDTAWDRHVFDQAETFGGAEIGFARALSSSILARLLGVEHAALVSVAGGEIPPTGNEALDDGLASARREALDTFSKELLGPVELEGYQIYAQPMLLDSPVPIGAAILAGREPLTAEQVSLLGAYLAHFDTRLNLAEHLLKLRREVLALDHELRRLRGDEPEPTPTGERKRAPLSSDLEQSLAELTAAVPVLELFGAPLPTEHFGDFCREIKGVTADYLAILEKAPNLYLDVPNGVDAKGEGQHSAPYLRLLEIMGSLRKAVRPLAHATADDLEPYATKGRKPTFADLTQVAASRAADETSRTILDIMNDQGEELELDAVAARHHPYEFRAANVGEVFALLALFRTLKAHQSQLLDQHLPGMLRALPKYQAARAYLFSFDRFEDVPLKGESRTELPAAENLLLIRENAPSFGVVLRAYQK